MSGRILAFGDSHADALQRALKHRAASSVTDHVRVLRFSRVKNGKEIGDVSLDAAAAMVAEASTDDLIASTIGGNQHQVFGLVEHSVAFDFIDLEGATNDSPPCVLIPYRTIWAVFEGGLRGRDGQRLTTLREAAGRPIYHLTPPPPKESAEHILKRHETSFREAGLAAKGVTPAPIRLKLWRLQCAVLQSLCTEWDIHLLPPPEGTQTPEGFLKPEYYANDATHANAAYGELVLRQLDAVAEAISPVRETA